MTSDRTTPLSPARHQAILDSFGRQGFLAGMGARIAALSAGRCTIELPFDTAVSQQHGFYHGGAIGALADSAGGYAAMTLAADGAEVLTLEYKINFLRPAAGSLLIAEGTVLRAGRSVTITRVDVHVVDGDRHVLCGAMQQSIMQVPHG